MPKDVKAEIESMIGELGAGSKQEEPLDGAAQSEAAGAAESGQDRGEDQTPGTESQAAAAEASKEQQTPQQKEATSGDAEGGEVDAGEEEAEVSDDPQAEIERLRAEVNRLAAEGQKKKDDGTAAGADSFPEVDFDPLEKHDFDRLIEDKEAFSSWAKSLFEKARSQAREDVLSQVPKTIQEQVNQQVAVRETVRDFYGANPDLKDYKSYVVSAAQEVAASDENKSFSEVLDEAAKRARKNLGLKAPKKKSAAAGSANSPAFGKASEGGSARKKDSSSENQLSDQEKQILDLINP